MRLFILVLDDMNNTSFTTDGGEYVWVQHYDRGQLCDEQPLTLKHARTVWHRLTTDGYTQCM